MDELAGVEVFTVPGTGAERVLVHDEEEQWRDEHVDDVVDPDRAEIAAVAAAG